MSSKHFLSVLLLAGLALCAGCLDYDQETIVAVISPDQDEARLVLVYEGLHAAPEDSSADEAKRQLKEFVEGQQFCLFGNWIGHVDLASFDQDDNGKSTPGPLREQVTVHNEGFFFNPNGRLCGWQTIRVNSLKKTIAFMNDKCSETVARDLKERREQIKSGDTNAVTAATVAALEKALREKFPWFEVEPGRISFTLVMASDEVDAGKMSLAENWKKTLAVVANKNKNATNAIAQKDLDDAAREAKDLSDGVDFLARNPLSFDQRFDRFKVSLGLGGGKPIRYVLKEAAKEPQKFEKELADYARTLKLPIKDKAETEAIIQDFLNQKSK